MKCSGSMVLASAMLMLAILPSRALALAGIAEHGYTFYFNPLAQLGWENPGDGCGGGDKFCLILGKENGEGIQGIDDTLEAINVPAEPTSPFIIARRSSDSRWFVYDLGQEKFSIADATLEEALVVWRDLGLAEPVFIYSRTPDRHLQETTESVERRWREKTVTMAVFELPLLVLTVLIFLVSGLGMRRSYHRTGARSRLVLAWILLLPAVLAGIAIVNSVGEVIATRLFGA